MDHLELHLDLLPSPLHKGDGLRLHKKAVEADIDIPRVTPDRIQLAVFSPLHLRLLQWLSIECEEPFHSTTIGSRKALICK